MRNVIRRSIPVSAGAALAEEVGEGVVGPDPRLRRHDYDYGTQTSLAILKIRVYRMEDVMFR